MFTVEKGLPVTVYSESKLDFASTPESSPPTITPVFDYKRCHNTKPHFSLWLSSFMDCFHGPDWPVAILCFHKKTAMILCFFPAQLQRRKLTADEISDKCAQMRRL